MLLRIFSEIVEMQEAQTQQIIKSRTYYEIRLVILTALQNYAPHIEPCC
jgi:hypothetical protein